MRLLRTSAAIACLSLCVWVCQSSAADLEQILKKGRVPGLSYAVIRAGKVETRALGVRDVSTGMPVGENTVFQAASLSKPVFAYAVLQLVDDGTLSLDTPLSNYVPDFVKDDPRAAAITARNVLRQASGLPNWRSSTTPLKTYFPQGERFSYSGEAFIWLQRVVEKITGQPLNDVVTRLVFDPLGMTHSSFLWRADFEADFAAPHDSKPAPGEKRHPPRALSASTLHTTVADYARFLQAVLSGARLEPETAKQWLDPQIRLRQHCIQCITADQPDVDQHVAWGLGWGLEPDEGSFFHWGDNAQYKAFVIGSRSDQSALVVFTNGSNGMAIMPDIADQLMPGNRPAFAWLNYSRSSAGRSVLDWLRAGSHQ